MKLTVSHTIDCDELQSAGNVSTRSIYSFIIDSDTIIMISLYIKYVKFVHILIYGIKNMCLLTKLSFAVRHLRVNANRDDDRPSLFLLFRFTVNVKAKPSSGLDHRTTHNGLVKNPSPPPPPPPPKKNSSQFRVAGWVVLGMLSGDATAKGSQTEHQWSKNDGMRSMVSMDPKRTPSIKTGKGHRNQENITNESYYRNCRPEVDIKIVLSNQNKHKESNKASLP